MTKEYDLSWTTLFRLFRLRALNPKRASRFRWVVIDYGVEQ